MKILRKIIRISDSLVNLLIVLFFVPIFLYGAYALWDSEHIYKQADSSLYQSCNPDSAENFRQLQRINPEVFGWLIVNDTNINYPLVQSEYNSKYVNTDVKGNFSLSGSIFLDCRSHKDFTDTNSIIYGHHMQEHVMFGEIHNFSHEDFFNSHKSGKIFYENKWHDIEFFAFVQGDAYDSILFNTELTGPKDTQKYLDYVKEKAKIYRDLPFDGDEHCISLSTCTSDSTNGRHILIGRITDK